MELLFLLHRPGTDMQRRKVLLAQRIVPRHAQYALLLHTASSEAASVIPYLLGFLILASFLSGDEDAIALWASIAACLLTSPEYAQAPTSLTSLASDRRSQLIT